MADRPTYAEVPNAYTRWLDAMLTEARAATI